MLMETYIHYQNLYMCSLYNVLSGFVGIEWDKDVIEMCNLYNDTGLDELII